jgi:hypothetical protein
MQRMRRQEQILTAPNFADDKHPKHAEFAEQDWDKEVPDIPEDWKKPHAQQPAAEQPAPEPSKQRNLPMEGRPRNTPVPAGGIMLGGAPDPRQTEVEDPWAPKEKKIKVGATVRLGGDDDG